MGVKIVTKELKQRPAKAPRGLGDIVEKLAKPIANMIGLKDCAPCQERKERLNRATEQARAGVRRIFGG